MIVIFVDEEDGIEYHLEFDDSLSSECYTICTSQENQTDYEQIPYNEYNSDYNPTSYNRNYESPYPLEKKSKKSFFKKIFSRK
ncbi:unnamed protein product [Brachionus calyciflorus]|uniref:Uncharacterized protein n=1 Tax=Brachionus calyciflorus TaxID=104777 RepID=A0A814BT07_9BILA|nr:unnamed protein product [Brachionus calyciflorus]